MSTSKRERMAFMCYARYDNAKDDNDKRGEITILRDKLEREVCRHLGNEFFKIFMDEDIDWGDHWEKSIKDYIDKADCFIPIISPCFFNSEYCCKEVELFLNREEKLETADLILPILYINTPVDLKETDLAKTIFSRQCEDWTNFRDKSIDSAEVKKYLTRMAEKICNAIKIRLTIKDAVDQKAHRFPAAPISEPGESDFIQRIKSVGIVGCELSLGDSTYKALDDVSSELCVMATAGSKFLSAKNFIKVVKDVIGDGDNIKILLACPKAEYLEERAPEEYPPDTLVVVVERNLHIFKQFKNNLRIRFYPIWYEPIIRAVFVDNKYALISFYDPPHRADELPQIKIESGDRSFYKPFKDIFEFLWNNGRDVDWEDIK